MRAIRASQGSHRRGTNLAIPRSEGKFRTLLTLPVRLLTDRADDRCRNHCDAFGIAIPLYNGYIRESHLATLRTDLNSLRTPIEDFRLDSTGYNDTARRTLNTYIADVLAEVNSGNYDYTCAESRHQQLRRMGRARCQYIWMRCEDRFRNCCDSADPGATAHDRGLPLRTATMRLPAPGRGCTGPRQSAQFNHWTRPAAIIGEALTRSEEKAHRQHHGQHQPLHPSQRPRPPPDP
jgi:hypothetical protein